MRGFIKIQVTSFITDSKSFHLASPAFDLLYRQGRASKNWFKSGWLCINFHFEIHKKGGGERKVLNSWKFVKPQRKGNGGKRKLDPKILLIKSTSFTIYIFTGDSHSMSKCCCFFWTNSRPFWKSQIQNWNVSKFQRTVKMHIRSSSSHVFTVLESTIFFHKIFFVLFFY